MTKPGSVFRVLATTLSSFRYPKSGYRCKLRLMTVCSKCRLVLTNRCQKDLLKFKCVKYSWPDYKVAHPDHKARPWLIWRAAMKRDKAFELAARTLEVSKKEKQYLLKAILSVKPNKQRPSGRKGKKSCYSYSAGADAGTCQSDRCYSASAPAQFALLCCWCILWP